MSTSQGHPVLDKAATISDSSAAKFRILTGDTTDTTNNLLVLKLATGETTRPIGVLQVATTAADERQTVRFMGISKVTVNGSGNAIDVNDMIVASSGGKGVKSTTPDATDQYPVGIAMAPSTADNDEIDVLLTPGALIVKGTG